jgi:nitrite reductase (cytochrome c-552)
MPRKRKMIFAVIVLFSAAASAGVAALLMSIFARKQEAQNAYVRAVEVTEATTDPEVWGMNWPRQYDSYKRTVDSTHTRYGGSDGISSQKLERDPWLKRMYSGYAFSLDYRDRRGHAYMLSDQQETERVKKKSQPGACLHCHSSVLNAYRSAGNGDIMAGFEKVNAMPYHEARNMTDAAGKKLIEHPVSCVDCHDPKNMELRVTRPGFINGIKALKASQGVKDYDVNRDATRQEMRTYACAQCHVEYYFKGDQKTLTYPWAKGVKVEEIEAYYDEIGFTDWKHGETGAKALKAQHPEFELWSQGIHAKSGVSCADCHMPYKREGAMKVSDHHVRSPLLNISRACQTCHPYPEKELLGRVEVIQNRTHDLIQRSAKALTEMMDAIRAAKAAGATEQRLEPALALHRKAQWRLDFVSSENSMGFHASQESARILAEAIDYARQAQSLAKELRADSWRAAAPPQQPKDAADPVEGVTPAEKAPLK